VRCPPAAVDDVSPRRDGPPLSGSWPDTARCGRSSPTRGWSEPARAAHRSPTSCKDLQGQDRPPGSVDARLSTAAGSLPSPPDGLPQIQQATHPSSLSDIPTGMPPGPFHCMGGSSATPGQSVPMCSAACVRMLHRTRVPVQREGDEGGRFHACARCLPAMRSTGRNNRSVCPGKHWRARRAYYGALYESTSIQCHR